MEIFLYDYSTFAKMEAKSIRERVLSDLNVAKVKRKTLGMSVENKNIDEVINDYINTNLSVVSIAKPYCP